MNSPAAWLGQGGGFRGKPLRFLVRRPLRGKPTAFRVLCHLPRHDFGPFRPSYDDTSSTRGRPNFFLGHGWSAVKGGEAAAREPLTGTDHALAWLRPDRSLGPARRTRGEPFTDR